jgi:hypothetical protein
MFTNTDRFVLYMCAMLVFWIFLGRVVTFISGVWK